jgi:hypothetical protein
MSWVELLKTHSIIHISLSYCELMRVQLTSFRRVLTLKRFDQLTCLITTLSMITTFSLSKSYFSSFHLVVVSVDDSNMRFFRKFSMRRRLILLKFILFSSRYKIIKKFNSSIINIQHSLFDFIRCKKKSFKQSSRKELIKKLIYW